MAGPWLARWSALVYRSPCRVRREVFGTPEHPSAPGTARRGAKRRDRRARAPYPRRMPERDASAAFPLTLGAEPTHCPACGKRLKPRQLEDDDRPRLVCPQGHVTWRNPRIVVGTLPVRDGRVHLARRAIEPAVGRWALSGRLPRARRGGAEGARRETEEETQLLVQIGRLIGAYSRPPRASSRSCTRRTWWAGRWRRARRRARCGPSVRTRSRGTSSPSRPRRAACATGSPRCPGAGRGSSPELYVEGDPAPR